MKKMIFPLFVLLIFAFACSNSADKEVKPSSGNAAVSVVESKDVAVPVAESKVEKVKSLRGGTEIPAGSNPSVGIDWQPKDTSIARTFEHQPPLIPHDMEDYGITASQNDCLDCHGDSDSDAPMPYKSHYTDRDGKTTKEISSRWYFCTQCHVGQVDAKPLVNNTFDPK